MASATGAFPTELTVRDLALNFMPQSLSRLRLRPYVAITAGGMRAPLRTRLGRKRMANYAWNSTHVLPFTPADNIVRVELWHRRRFRRDLLLGSGILNLAELRTASQAGYALDRWVPITMSPIFTAAPGVGTTMGMVHCIARSMIPARNIAIVPAAVPATAATGIPAAGAVSGIGMQQPVGAAGLQQQSFQQQSVLPAASKLAQPQPIPLQQQQQSQALGGGSTGIAGPGYDTTQQQKLAMATATTAPLQQGQALPMAGGAGGISSFAPSGIGGGPGYSSASGVSSSAGGLGYGSSSYTQSA